MKTNWWLAQNRVIKYLCAFDPVESNPMTGSIISTKSVREPGGGVWVKHNKVTGGVRKGYSKSRVDDAMNLSRTIIQFLNFLSRSICVQACIFSANPSSKPYSLIFFTAQ